MRHFTLFILTLALLAACRGKQGEVVISGQFKNLNQADFYIYSLDDGRSTIDTIHVQQGKFEYVAPLHGQATLHLVYPHLAEQIIFAHSGDVIHIKGDANNLRSVKIDGNAENKQYTQLRLQLASASDEAERQRLVDDIVAKDPTSLLGTYLMQWQMSQLSSPIAKGKPLPFFILYDSQSADQVPQDKSAGRRLFNADSLSLQDLAGHRTIIAFWAQWHRSSGTPIRNVRKLLNQDDSLYALTCSADIAYADHWRIMRRDSLLSDKYAKRWRAYCDLQGPDAGLFARWRVYDLPFFILIDTLGVIEACGTDFDNDILPLIEQKS